MPAAARLLQPPPSLSLDTYGTSGGGSGGATIIVANDSCITTWRGWNEAYTSATTVSATMVTGIEVGTSGASGTASATIWVAWNEDYATNVSSSTTSAIIDPWPAWNRTFTGSGTLTVTALPRISNEECQARLQRQEAERRERAARWEAERPEREERQRAEAVEWEAAKVRAAIILRETLSPEQQAELAEKAYFTLRTIRPTGEERFYRIHRGRSHNVERVDAAGRRIQRYCMHPVVQCPDEDTMLTQKLWLQNPELEEEFLRRANRS